MSVLNPVAVLGHAVWETLVISVPAVLKARTGRLTSAECDDKLRTWAAKLLDFARVRLEVVGLENLPGDGRSVVVVSNHQSLYDIPILYRALPLALRMAAKKELFQTPIWGKAMEAAGFVKIDRTNRKKAYEALMGAGTRLSSGQLSLHIAPEGTRSKTGELGPFKRGAFELAWTSQLPVVPVCISGAIFVHRSGTWTIHRGQSVKVTVLPLLRPSDFASSGELRHAAHSAIADCLRPQNVTPA